jgi:5'-deoxynucleotidase YfbR-like HD superfamily hydrolase
MTELIPDIQEQAQQAHDNLMLIGGVSVKMAGIERLTCLPAINSKYTDEALTERHENDAEHSYHLGLSAVELAATYYPELDTGLVAQFSLVHDMDEIIDDDMPSYDLTDEQRAEKAKSSQLAVTELLAMLPPYLADLLKRYEEQEEPEARFVRFVDKLMPAIVHFHAIAANQKVFLPFYDIESKEQLEETSRARTQVLRDMFPEFDFLHIVRELTSATSRNALFPST